MRMNNIVYLGMGSNIGNRAKNLKNAIEALSPSVEVITSSPIYETPPWGFEAQAKFLNQVIKVKTDLLPEDLLVFVKKIEVELGRTPNFLNGPRLIDIDILFYNDLVLETESLIIPHPRVHQRAFMLVPMKDIASEFYHPILKQSIHDLLDKVDTAEVTLYKAELAESPISRKHQFVFWLILGAFSVVFAEVVSASEPFPFTNPIAILLVIPLYTLHTLVLASLVYRKGNPNMRTLFFAGAIFGLYEAYITKVLWNPPWGAFVPFGGLALAAIAMLILWWHPIMAFIIPLLVTEELATSSHSVSSILPEKLRNFLNKPRNLFFLVAIAGIIQGTGIQNPSIALSSNLIALFMLYLLLQYWKKIGGNQYRLVDLLPNKKQARNLLILLALYYLITLFTLRPEEIPSFAPQLNIWLIYGFFCTLLYISLKRSKESPLRELINPLNSENQPKLRNLFITFVLVSMIVSTLAPLKDILALLHWGFGILFGILILVVNIRQLIKNLPEKQPHEQQNSQDQ